MVTVALERARRKARKAQAWRVDLAARARIADAADLANYQLTAVWAGLVDSVLWLRPGWGH